MSTGRLVDNNDRKCILCSRRKARRQQPMFINTHSQTHDCGTVGGWDGTRGDTQRRSMTRLLELFWLAFKISPSISATQKHAITVATSLAFFRTRHSLFSGSTTIILYVQFPCSGTMADLSVSAVWGVQKRVFFVIQFRSIMPTVGSKERTYV